MADSQTPSTRSSGAPGTVRGMATNTLQRPRASATRPAPAAAGPDSGHALIRVLLVAGVTGKLAGKEGTAAGLRACIRSS